MGWVAPATRMIDGAAELFGAAWAYHVSAPFLFGRPYGAQRAGRRFER